MARKMKCLNLVLLSAKTESANENIILSKIVQMCPVSKVVL